ncbi:MAG: glycosyltransferase family 2 protein [Chloroflexota bacterium]
MAENVSISVVIVNFNTCDLLRDCLDNLVQLEEVQEIIVVDNASVDGSVAMVSTEFPGVHVIALSENRGLTVASNLGMDAAIGEFILYLGSDAFPKVGTIMGLAHYLSQHEDVGIATAKLVLRDGQLDMDAHRGFPSPWASLTHFTKLNRLFPTSPFFNQYFLGHLPLDTAHEIDLCISHFMFMRKSLFDADNVGRWDEDFFVYGEDVDMCYRVKAAGYKIMYLPQFGATHIKGASVGIRKQSQDISKASPETKVRAAQMSTEAMALFYEKHFHTKYPWVVNTLILTAVRFLGWFRVWRIRRNIPRVKIKGESS